ncbi:hypothetical protein KC219_20625, partial [Mycobacterium tuberculosis]|nr:hypothetical protein [Mycobacterium tuberculosis]
MPARTGGEEFTLLLNDTRLAEAAQRVAQRGVVHVKLGRFSPDLACVVLLARLPQHFAQVRTDFGLRGGSPRLAQDVGGAGQIAATVFDPAEAVGDI